MHRTFIALVLAWLAAAGLGPVLAQPLTAGFQGSFTFQLPDGTPLQATLTLPQGTGPFPLLVVLHGATGPSPLEAQDVADLVPRGYAVAVVDSFTGRGFKPGASGGAGTVVRPPTRVPDAYQALRQLAMHPQIDARRAVLFGRSHGAATTMVAATTWAVAQHGVDGLAFKAFVALYPSCSATYPQFDALAGPLRLHLADKDELTPARPCEAVVARMAAAGQDASAMRYADAHHAFDAPWPVSYFGQWANYGGCAVVLPTPDDVPSADVLKQCVRRGTSMGGNPRAAAQFREHLAGELARLLAQ